MKGCMYYTEESEDSDLDSDFTGIFCLWGQQLLFMLPELDK